MDQPKINNVIASKMAAKQDMAELLWPAIGATALYLIPSILISAIFSLAMGGGDVEALAEIPLEKITLYMCLYVMAQIFVVAPLYFGLTQYYALRRAGARPSASMVTMCLSSLKLYTKSVRLYLAIAVHSFLWALPLIAVSVIASLIFETVLPNTVGYFILFEIIIVGVMMYACLVCRYQCAYALVMEDSKLGCWKAVRKAAELFKGHKKEILSLICSFFFWFILTAMLSQWLMLYVCPYFLLSLYHLFDRIRGVQVITKPANTTKT